MASGGQGGGIRPLPDFWAARVLQAALRIVPLWRNGFRGAGGGGIRPLRDFWADRSGRGVSPNILLRDGRGEGGSVPTYFCGMVGGVGAAGFRTWLEFGPRFPQVLSDGSLKSGGGGGRLSDLARIWFSISPGAFRWLFKVRGGTIFRTSLLVLLQVAGGGIRPLRDVWADRGMQAAMGLCRNGFRGAGGGNPSSA